jgi:hypothetical protein
MAEPEVRPPVYIPSASNWRMTRAQNKLTYEINLDVELTDLSADVMRAFLEVRKPYVVENNLRQHFDRRRAEARCGVGYDYVDRRVVASFVVRAGDCWIRRRRASRTRAVADDGGVDGRARGATPKVRNRASGYLIAGASLDPAGRPTPGAPWPFDLVSSLS